MILFEIHFDKISMEN